MRLDVDTSFRPAFRRLHRLYSRTKKPAPRSRSASLTSQVWPEKHAQITVSPISVSSSNFSTSSTVHEQHQPEPTRGALDGIKILDLSRILAAPFCTSILADYGADVIKVEVPGQGDDTRHWRTSNEDAMWNTEGPMSHYFAAINRNKRSITLNLKRKEALEALYELVKTCDVVIENFIPGKADELGIGYSCLSKHNPRIIYASISGFGASSPRAGYDMIAAAEGGLMHITGEPGRPPVRPGLGLTDMCTGLYMHGAILAALHARNSTGRGQKIDASLFETQIALLVNVGANWLNMGIEGKRYGAAHPSIVPYNTFETADGYLALGANSDRQFRILCQRLGRAELLEDERFGTNSQRVRHREVLDGVLNELFKEKTVDEWLRLLEGSGLAFGPVNSIEKAFQHPQTQARDMVQTLECDVAQGGEIKVIGPPVKFSETKGRVRKRPPLLGEHTEEVLQEIGYAGERIEELRRAGAV